MEPLLHAASSLSAVAAGNLISAIWQGAVLAAGVALCLRLTPRLNAAARSMVWLGVFAVLVLLHILPAFFGHGTGLNSGSPAPFELDLRWSLAIAAVWIALSLWRAGQLMLSAVNVYRLARRSKPMEVEPELRELLRTRHRAVELCTSDEVARPSVFGFLHPRVLLPPGLAEELTPIELRQVIVHEMEHLRRADDWTNLLQKLALVFFPLNPALLWVERRLCAERELACDDRVLASGSAGKAYAICLTRLAEYSMLRRSLSLVLGAWERRPELFKRVHRLLRRPHVAMGSMQAKVITAGLMAAMAGGAFELAHSPQLVGFAAASAAPAQSASIGTGSIGAPHSFAQPAVYRAENRRQGIASPQVMEAKAVTSTEQEHGPAQASPKSARKHMCRHKAAPSQDPSQDPSDGGWVVLTEWTDTALPPHALVAVKFDPRATYALVPVRGGWLIVQI